MFCLAKLIILDVGHGNCAVLQVGRGTVVIDTGFGDTLLRLLEQRQITWIDAVLISHADADHIGGLLTLLTQKHLAVRSVFLNTESLRTTALWREVLVALTDARRRQGVKVHSQLTSASNELLCRDGIEVQVLAPSPELALVGAGGQIPEGGPPLSANAMSAVIRVVANGIPEALLPGDLDAAGLERLLAEYPEPHARVLVFPHHGGRPARADPVAFAARLCAAVQADLVIFSIGRGKHATPHPEVIRGVLQTTPEAHIACTQLSKRCAVGLPNTAPAHLNTSPARGQVGNTCCAGTIELSLGGDTLFYSPAQADHRRFVEREAPTALCMGHGTLLGLTSSAAGAVEEAAHPALPHRHPHDGGRDRRRR
jgi:beta-lactamase superfamily II metal-dependent hydrolase